MQQSKYFGRFDLTTRADIDTSELGTLKAEYRVSYRAGIVIALMPIFLTLISYFSWRQQYPDTAIAIAVITGVVTGFMWLIFMTRFIRTGDRVRIYQNGIVEHKRRKSVAIRWDEIDMVAYELFIGNDVELPKRPPINEKTGAEIYPLIGLSSDFWIVSSSGEITVGNQPLYRKAPEIIKTVQQELLKHQLAIYKSAFDNGNPIDFGELTLEHLENKTAIKFKQSTIALDKIKQVVVHSHYLAFFSEVTTNLHPLHRTSPSPIGWCYMVGLENFPILLGLLSEYGISVEIKTNPNMPVIYRI
jgi:hypothetical protein